MNIEINYDGACPSLCMGKLIVTIDGVVYNFPKYCLESGGSVTFDEDRSSYTTDGEWSIDRWPENFPENLKKSVLKAVNSNIQHGCCGGCRS